MRIVKNTKIDFIKYSKSAVTLSAILILSGVFSLISNKGPKLSIDFNGGTLIAVQYKKEINLNSIRTGLKEIEINGQIFDFSKSEIKNFGNNSAVSIRIANLENEPENFSETLVNILKKIHPNNIPNNPDDFVLSIEKVGPKIGSELSGKALMAILYAILLILIYISIRFEFIYAIGAIAAIFHDVIITLGIFSILGYEISLAIIAAFLTIVGYSLNDTIVIFDRIRENMKTLKREDVSKVVNQSINESLSRTVVTSLTTLFVVLTLYLFGGNVLQYFSFAMIIGVMVGTYSSIFIASNIVVYMNKKS
tara:strand:+ start:1451 stop:2374 length:924 start_codon:yes stop_codon:yes gene_type:complete